jgi:hypothetical protein
MRDYERRISFYNRYFVFKKVRSIDNAESVVKSLLGTSTAFEKQMAALEEEQTELDEAAPVGAAPVGAVVATKPKPKPKPRAKPLAAATAPTAPAPTAPAPTAPAPTEKKKPGRKPKIQLIVKESSEK